MKKLKSALFILAAFLSVSAQRDQNPATLWCDYHNAQFVKGGVEFPAGVCHDVYTHTYYDASVRKTRTHKMTMRCPK
jgi:hypothetical protein